MRCSDQTVLVTGADGGIGRAICRAFWNESARIAVADLPGSAGAAFVAELGTHAIFIALDVTRETEWDRALDEVEAAFGSLDVVVNNAGFFQPAVPFEAMPLDLWRRHTWSRHALNWSEW